MYEYDFEFLKLSQKEEEALQMGVPLDPAVLNERIKEVLNKRADDGWEPIPPMLMPTLWFKKELYSE